ncbi:MAG: hypothetical protein ACFB8W_03500 [Elainellaceae cyanobacterium]
MPPLPAASTASASPTTTESRLRALLAKFYASYPMASLYSELLAIQADVYVVRACVSIGPSLMATGMAAAANVEAAEDQAKVRVLELLNYPGAAARHQPVATSPAWPSSSTLTSASTVDFPSSEAVVPPAQATSVSPVPPPIPRSLAPDLEPPLAQYPPAIAPPPSARPLVDGDTPPSAAPRSQDESPIPGLDTDSDPTRSPSSYETAGRGATTSPTSERSPRKPSTGKGKPAPSSGGTIDLSDIIAKTSVELTRLGWTEEQGREHLQQAYGKRSRQQLTDPELLDFLRYLEAQPTPPPFL